MQHIRPVDSDSFFLYYVKFLNMPPNHSLPYWTALHNRTGRRSIVMLSRKPTKKLLLFVHGFNGSPYSTWDNFAGYIPTRQEFSGHDVIFYNYDSKNVQTTVSGITFCDFLHEITKVANPFEKAFRGTGLQRSEDFRYEEIVLVGHSLGSIVLRHALIHSDTAEKYWWANISKLILFAPAHKGAIAVKPLLELFYPWFAPLASLVRIKIPTIDDVDLGSPTCTIHGLLAKSEKLEQANKSNLVKSKVVIWAETEKIVKNEIFHIDPPGVIFYKKRHTTLCSPYMKFLEPVDIIAQNL